MTHGDARGGNAADADPGKPPPLSTCDFHSPWISPVSALLGRIFFSRKSGVVVIWTLDCENALAALELGELFFQNETLVSPKLL